MELPKLPRQRFTLPRPAGSADALLLAQLASAKRRPGSLTAIVTADATDAQRLMDELAFFAPDAALRAVPRLGDAALRHLLAAPGPDQRAPGHAVAHPAARQGRPVPTWSGARHHGAVPAGAAPFLAGYTFHFKQKQKLDEAAAQGQLTLAGYSHVSQVVSPGEYAVRGGLIDLFPMGSAGALPGGPVRRRDRQHPHLRPRQPAQPVPGARGAAAAGPRVPHGRRARAFRSRWRELLDGDPTKSRIYKDIGNGVATAGIEYYLPLFFDDTATVFDYLGARPPWCCTATWSPPSSASGRTRERYRLVQGDPERPVLPPEALFLGREFLCPRQCRTPSWPRPGRLWRTRPTQAPDVAETARPDRGARRRRPAGPPARPTCAQPRSTACWCWPRAPAARKPAGLSCAPAA
jgi:transcription-repair coupling factor (superfamily II helicase)